VYAKRNVGLNEMLRCSIISACLLALSACSAHIAYISPRKGDIPAPMPFGAAGLEQRSIYEHHFVATPHTSDRSYGTVRVDFSRTESVHIPLQRENHAYLAQVPLLEGEKYVTSFTCGRDPEHKYMAGLQFKWRF
jgi:hypothetical protein